MASTSASSSEPVQLWALPSGRRLGPPLQLGDVGDISLSPDGRTLVVAQRPGVDLIDVATRRRRTSLRQSAEVSTVRFTPDSRFIVGGSWKGWARLWSAATGKPAGRPLAGLTGAVLWESISPDGRTLATGSLDGTVRLIDLRAQLAIGAPLPGLPNRAVAPVFSPDGAALFAISGAGRAYHWDVRPSAWTRHACAVAGRRLTRAEWRDALPDRKYAPACGG
jgi:WD40 repeat protein